MEENIFFVFTVTKATRGVFAYSHAELGTEEGTHHMLGEWPYSTRTMCTHVCLRLCYGTGNTIHSSVEIQIFWVT